MEMGHAGTKGLQASLRAFHPGPLGLVPCNMAVAPTQSQASPHTPLGLETSWKQLP